MIAFSNACVVAKKPVGAGVYRMKTHCDRHYGNNGKGKELRNVLKVVEQLKCRNQI